MRKFLAVIAVFVVLAVAALLILPHFIDINRYHDRIQAELQQRLGRSVSLGPMSLKLLPPAFSVQNAVIGEDPSFNTGTPFAQVQELRVSVKLLPLLRKDVQISSLELRRPAVELVRNQQGTWNFSSIGQQGGKAQPAKPSGQQGAPQGAQKFELAELAIADGSVGVTDQQKKQPRAVYDHIDLTLRDFAPDRPFSITLAAHLPGEGKQTVSLDGKGGPINNANPAQTPFDGQLKLENVAIGALQKYLNSPAMAGTDGVLSGQADVSNKNGKIASKGSLKLEKPRVRNVEVGYPITADYNVSDDLNNEVITVGQTTIKLGSTPLTISGSVNAKNTPALTDLNVQANNVSIAEMARLAAAFGVAMSPGMQMAGNLTLNVHAQGAVDSPALNGTVSGRNLAVSGGQLPAPVTVAALELALSPQKIDSNSFTAQSGGTSVNLQFSLTQYTTTNPMVDAMVKANNANVAELVHMAQAAGASSLAGSKASGTLSLDVHASGPVKQTENMNFSGSGQLQNASIQTADMTGPLKVQNATLQFTQNSAVLRDLAASVGSMNARGNLTLRNFQAPQVQFALSADNVNVVELQKIFGSGASQPQQQQKKSEPSLLTRTTGTGTLAANRIAYDQLVLENVRANVTLDRGLVRLDPLTSQLYGGAQSGSIIADLRPAQPTFNVNLKTQKVDSNKLLSAVSNVKDTLYGQLATGSQLSFGSPAAGSDIARTLNGKASLNLTDGKLTKVDLLQQIGQVARFTSLGRQAGNSSNIQQLGGDFDIRNGVANTNNLKMIVDGNSLAGTGSVDLSSQAVNMKVTAVLNKGNTQTVGGTQVGGFMQTALANKNGELVVPLLVTGTFSNLHFAPDVQQMAEMKAKNLLPSLANPGQLNSGILGAITGRGQGSQGQGQGGVGGVIGGLLGGKQQQQQQQPGAAAQQQKQQPQQQQQQKGLGGILGGVLGGKR